MTFSISQAGVRERIGSLPGFSLTSVPFPAQHAILQVIQRHLENHAFQFLQKWLLPECARAGWTCPETLELHKLFDFLDGHRDPLKARLCHLSGSSFQRWRRVISNIRHAAVHRIPQPRNVLLRMIRCAIGFLDSIAVPESSRSFCRLYKFLKSVLSNSDRLVAHLRYKVDSQILLCESNPQHLSHRLGLLPEATKRVLESNHTSLITQVRDFLHSEFK